MRADLLEECVDRVLPVEELPHINARRIQAKRMTRFRIKEDSPVVKLLPEHDKGVGYGFLTVYHGSAVPNSDG